MYNMDGEFVQEFEGMIDAVRFLCPGKEIRTGHMSRSIKNQDVFMGHLFSYEKLDKYPTKKHHAPRSFYEAPNTGKKVGRYDDDGNLLETFETLTACRKAGYKNVRAVIEGKREHCKGYAFKYLD